MQKGGSQSTRCSKFGLGRWLGRWRRGKESPTSDSLVIPSPAKEERRMDDDGMD